MPRRTRRQLVGKQEDYERYVRERRLVFLRAALRSQWLMLAARGRDDV